jgi:hypothetical protein
LPVDVALSIIDKDVPGKLDGDVRIALGKHIEGTQIPTAQAA